MVGKTLRRLGFLTVAGLCAATAALCAGCGGSGHSRPAAEQPSASVIVSATPTAFSLPAHLIGLSLEASSLARNQFAGTDLGAYLRDLDSDGILRIGGNSVDETFWTSAGERPPAWSQGTITPESISSLARTIAGTGWRVILGVNLKHFDPGRAADEARVARRILGRALLAIEIGNEPDYYYRSETTFFSAFQRYVRAIRAAVPGVGIAGPEAGRDDPRFVAAFARQQAPDPDITLLTTHNYPLSVCGGSRPTLSELLSYRVLLGEEAAAVSAATAGVTDRVPAVIDETNSVVCWGATGVSNVFGSALWALDYSLSLADHGVAGADFHGKVAGCNPYSPLCPSGNSRRLTAQPEFYGLLALRQIGAGRFLRLTSTAPVSLRAFAVSSGPGRLAIVLDDFGGDVLVVLHLPSSLAYARARETVLSTASTAGLYATRDVTLGGRQVGADGSTPPVVYTPVEVTGHTAVVNVNAHSANIIVFTGRG
jgi:hypothetical protein